jgi:hypothetical protein
MVVLCLSKKMLVLCTIVQQLEDLSHLLGEICLPSTISHFAAHQQINAMVIENLDY